MSNRFYPNTGKVLSTHYAPVMVDCNFIVDSTNGNGLGIRSLKGNGVANVFMHTSASPGSNNNYLNPNPASGLIVVQLADNYNRLYDLHVGEISPVSGTPLTSVTAGSAYVITSLGTATQAQFQAIGLLQGITPAVGAAFIASSSTAVPGGATVMASLTSGIFSYQGIGDANQTIAPVGLVAIPGIGAQLILQCLNASGALTAPAAGTVISIDMLFSNSSVTVAGE